MGKIDLTRVKEYLSTQPVLRAWLFGSYARGEETERSDVDILIQYDDNAKIGLLRHADLIISLEKILNRSVDLVTEGSLLSWVRPYVDADKILIYERRD